MPPRKAPSYQQLYGQEELVTKLSALVEEGRLPHALLFTGEPGGEALHLALAVARHILCQGEKGTRPCGSCTSCKKVDILQHPDLYLSFPIVKEGNREVTSQDFLPQFRQLLLEQDERVTEEEWRAMLNAKNKQLQIYVSEAEYLLHVTSLRSFGSNNQVVLMWLPEAMRVETANKLLKVIEEPPAGVIFLLVSHQPDKLLPTIISRLQRVVVPAIPEPTLLQYLQEHNLTAPPEVPHLAQGNLYKLLRLLNSPEEQADSIHSQTLQLLLLPLRRSPKLFKERADALAQLNRPDVIAILEEAPLILREALALRYGAPEVVYVPQQEQPHVARIAEHLALAQYPHLLDELTSAKMELRQNANIRMVCFDLLMKLATFYANSNKY